MSGLPATFQLFGPNQAPGSLSQAQGGNVFKWVGSALSASTKTLFFNVGVPWKSLLWARWVHIWTPGIGGAVARLVHCDDGPANITEIWETPVQRLATPVPVGVAITDQLNALIQAGAYKVIGFQIKDDGVHKWTLYESRLELVFDV